ncbi:hypothetical protein PAHAL_3G221400 [Panicum hallii]|uniref:F-box associated domain-containing protein n=1 Tax=Panicum hallii TaxID=206008 RepID=A0A2S3HAN0_9POAL|nr:uncharacterized protein LOC112886255 [Panicum hallii]PAN18731.1 hypothetical protein PAHAL_3G221400 [Panicum hallii]
MMNRRFLYLLRDSVSHRLGDSISQLQSNFALHRINMSGLFYPTRPPPNRPTGAADAGRTTAAGRSPNTTVTVEDARLPRPLITFQSPSSYSSLGCMGFMLFSSARGGKDQIVGIDQWGNTLLYSTDLHFIRVMPTLKQRKRMPISLVVGDSLYTMDTFPRPSDAKCFEVLTHCPTSSNLFSKLDWQTLPPPPFVFEPFPELPKRYIRSYTVVRHSDILVSVEDVGTYSFDTVSRAWRKTGDWVLPFSGRAEYIPEYDLWFGLSSYADNNLLCTSDLSAASVLKPPTLRHIWEDELRPPEDWVRGWAYAVHLGSGKFCIARFFETPEEEPCEDPLNEKRTQARSLKKKKEPCEDGSAFIRWGRERFAVLTGVEVERCGEAGGGLRMITHRSKRYRLANSMLLDLVL